MDVPEGTAAEVLAWVGSDPARAQAALDVEYYGQNRSTLIAKLETIASKEAPAVSDTTTTEPEEVDAPPEGNAPGPEQPSGDDLVVDLLDNATVIGPRNTRTPDVVIPENNYDSLRDEAIEAGEEEALVDAGGVEFFQLASNNGVVVIRFNQFAGLLDAQQAVALARDLRSALANTTY